MRLWYDKSKKTQEVFVGSRLYGLNWFFRYMNASIFIFMDENVAFISFGAARALVGNRGVNTMLCTISIFVMITQSSHCIAGIFVDRNQP